MSTTDIRDKLLALDIATHEDGRILYYGLEWCKQSHIVIIFDDEAKGWMRGDEGLRYRVMMTTTHIKGPFPAGKVLK